MEYKLYEPELKESWSNGFIAFAAHPPIRRKNPCYLVAQGCHDKEHLGWQKACGNGNHRWELNFYRHHSHHYHCLYCGIADDLSEFEVRLQSLGLKRGSKVAKDWIEKLEQQSGT